MSYHSKRETSLSELELVFNSEHELSTSSDYEKEASELLSRYHRELNKQKIADLTLELESLDESSDRYDEIMREINEIQHACKMA